MVEPGRHPAAAPAGGTGLVRLLSLAGVLLALLAHPGEAAAADDVAVEAQREGEAVRVRARATVHATLETIWSTLTDYDHIARFIPGFSESRVLSRSGASAIVRQRGEARFLLFAFPIDVVVESTERPPWEISVRALKGNMRRLEGAYHIVPVSEGAQPRYALRWVGVIEPDDGLPPLFGEALMRVNIEDQFLGMVREIERRQSARGGTPAR